jgi:hypothetical protein
MRLCYVFKARVKRFTASEAGFSATLIFPESSLSRHQASERVDSRPSLHPRVLLGLAIMDDRGKKQRYD